MTYLGRIVGDFVSGVRFLTVIPIPGRSARLGSGAFPAVGAAIGGCLVAADWGLSFLPWELRNLLLVVFGAFLTGGLHYDGLADFLDGLGGQDRSERLRILADPGVGVFGVLGLVLAVGVRVAALSLLAGDTRIAALVVAPTLARWAMVVTATKAPSARPTGLGAVFVASIGRGSMVAAASTAFLVAGLVGGIVGLASVGLTLAVVVLVRRSALRELGGVNGDVLGACGEITETLVLVAFGAGGAVAL